MEVDAPIYNKLLKCGVFRENLKAKADTKRQKVVLDSESSAIMDNGIALGGYLLVLKEALVILKSDDHTYRKEIIRF